MSGETLQLLPGFSHYLSWYLMSWNKTQQSANCLVYLQTASANPTESTFTFNSLWIVLMTWASGSFVHKWHKEMSFNGILLYLYFSLYSITFTWVRKSNQYFTFTESFLNFYLGKECFYFCHFCSTFTILRPYYILEVYSLFLFDYSTY